MPLLDEQTKAEQTPIIQAEQPDLSLVPKPTPEQVVEFQNDNRTATQKLLRSFERGQLIHDRGELGIEFAYRNSPEVQNKLKEVEKRQQELGLDDNEGFVGYLGEAAEIVGQMSETFVSEELVARVSLGAGVGTTVGLVGGPFAGITVPAGATLGGLSGLITHFMIDSFTVEGGNAYLDMVGEGIDKDVARFAATGVGIVNAGLEVTGAGLLAKPFITAGKRKIFREGMKAAIKRDDVLAAARQFGIDYSAGVAGEVVTENLQELTNIAATEIAKEFTEEELENITLEEIGDRLAEITIKTFKGMSVLALPGPAVNFTTNTVRARQANQDKANLEKLKVLGEELETLDLTAADVVDVQEEAMEQSRVRGIRIPVDQLDQYALDQGLDPNVMYEQFGVTDQVEEARLLGSDVEFTNRQYLQHIQRTDAFESLIDHVRFEPDDMTVSEAKEFNESGLQDEVTLSIEPNDTVIVDGQEISIPEDQIAQPVEQTEELAIAEAQLGLQAMFTSAREAGLTNKQFETYLTAIQKAADLARTQKERADVKAELRENSKSQKLLRERLKEEARESVNQQPVYAAINAIGSQRLDHGEVLELLQGNEASLRSLPKQSGNRNIFTNKSEGQGLSPETLAELYGFDGADVMLFQMIDSPRINEAIEAETDRLLQQRGERLIAEREVLESTMSALHNDRQGEVLALELNSLREAIGEKKLKLPLLRASVRARLGEFQIRDISPAKFMAVSRREGRNAARLLRKGDRQEAAKAKFRQLLNFQFAQQAFTVREQVKTQRKFFQRWQKKPKRNALLPIDYHLAIQQALGIVQFKNRLSPAKRQELLQKWARKEALKGTAVQLPKRVVEDDGSTPYTELTLNQWNQMHALVKEVEHKGKTEGKLLRKTQQINRQIVVDQVVKNVEANLKDRSGTFTETNWERRKAQGREFANLLLNADSILRNVDGFKDLGPAYLGIKGGIDKAMTEGYNSDQVGFVRRLKAESTKITELFSVFTKKELLNLTKRVDIPGVRSRMSQQRILAVLLNSGNIDNRAALIDSGQFTEEEIDIIHDFATEKDWQFTQSVWDYLDVFWPEVKDAVKRRKNVEAKRVAPTQISNRHGKFRGGYYPLQYDSRESIVSSFKSVDEILSEERFGRATASHTQDGHTKERTDSNKRAVKLDLLVINNHVNQVTYDLEMGDAVHDSYKVLYHPDTKKAFRDTGNVADWEALDLWLSNVVTGEVHMSGVIEEMARHLRAGFTVSKIGFNLGTIALQPLGLLQTAVQIGKTNTLNGLRAVIFSPQIGPNNIYDAVARESGFMEEREATFQQDIVVAKQLLKSSFIRRLTPGNSAQFIAEAAFYGIKKVQRFVDTATWLGAKKDGLARGMSEEDSTRHADRMVARSQASGNFQERTPFERGSISKKVKQSETIRAMVPLISYFMAKTNVAFERTKKTEFIDPNTKLPNVGATLNWAADMAMLYVVEALLANIIRQGLPDDLDDLWETAVIEGLSSFAAGIPIVRDLWSEAVGFRGGGVFGSTLGEASKLAIQIKQGEFDTALVKSAGRLFGTLFAVPGANQIIKTGVAIKDYISGEDVDMLEFMMGPRWKKR